MGGGKLGVFGQFFIKSMAFEGKQPLQAGCPNVSHVWYEESQAML